MVAFCPSTPILKIVSWCSALSVGTLHTGGGKTARCDSGPLQYFEPLWKPPRAICLCFPAHLTVVVNLFPENRMCVKDILTVLWVAFLIRTAAVKKQSSSQLLPQGFCKTQQRALRDTERQDYNLGLFPPIWCFVWKLTCPRLASEGQGEKIKMESL